MAKGTTSKAPAVAFQWDLVRMDPALMPGAYRSKLIAARRYETRFDAFVQVAFEIVAGTNGGRLIVDTARDTISMGSKLPRIVQALGGGGTSIEPCVGGECLIVLGHEFDNGQLRTAIAQAHPVASSRSGDQAQ